MTKQQNIFIDGKAELDHLAKLAEEGLLTPEGQEEIDAIKTLLFESVVRYGIIKARARMKKYRKPNDAFQDIQQDFAMIFFRQLPHYDPIKSTPTTYFSPYFDQVISEYVLKYSQNMSQYDANNVSAVRRAIEEFESHGEKWDESMLSARTGLSVKVVRRTLTLASNSIIGNIDDEMANSGNSPAFTAKSPTPEEEYFQKEETNTISRVVSESLTRDEQRIFLYKINLDGRKERFYQQVANDLHLPVKDVKRIWNQIINRLSNNAELRDYRYGANERQE